MDKGGAYTHTMEYHSATKERDDGSCSNTGTVRDYQTKRSRSERKRQISYAVISVWNLKYGTNEPIYETEITQRTDGSLPRRLGEGWIGSLGLADADQDGKTRSYCIAQGTKFNILG